MGNQARRGEGAVQEVVGKAKAAAGRAVGNPRMEAEGRAKAHEGQGRQAVATAAERLKGKGEELSGAIKNRVGHAIDNQQMEAEGKGRQLKGQARQAFNKK